MPGQEGREFWSQNRVGTGTALSYSPAWEWETFPAKSGPWTGMQWLRSSPFPSPGDPPSVQLLLKQGPWAGGTLPPTGWRGGRVSFCVSKLPGEGDSKGHPRGMPSRIRASPARSTEPARQMPRSMVPGGLILPTTAEAPARGQWVASCGFLAFPQWRRAQAE